jgi:hypothetical protein
MRLPRPFARAKPTTPPPQQRARGGSGRWHTDGFLEYEEINADLVHPAGYAVYDRMWRTDPDVRRVWGMWTSPIIAGTWQIEPHGGDEADDQAREDAALVEWVLFEHLRGGLHGHLSEALATLRHGFAPFEHIWHAIKHDGQQLLVPEYLGLRLPRSVQRWLQDDREQLAGIEQLTIDRGLIEIPADGLVYYRVGAEGDNWEGVSPLRAVYKPWFIKDGIERLDAVAQERQAVGVAVLYPPEHANNDDGTLDAVEDAIAGLRGGETAHIVMPGPHADNAELGQGWRFEIQGMGAASQSGRSAQPSLQYFTDKIAAGLIAEFMRLGQSGEGARATADVQQDPFYAAVEGFTSTVVEPPLQALTELIVRVNRGERDGYPKIRMSLVDAASLTELADYVNKLSAAGALAADDPLEDYLRQRGDLPPADPQAREQRKQQAEEDRQIQNEAAAAKAKATAAGDGSGGSQDPSSAARTPDTTVSTFGRQRREPRHWERHMSLDQIEEAIDGARARFEQAGTDTSRTVARDVAAAVAAGKEPTAKPPAELVDALAEVLQDLYTLGRTTVRDELARQAGRVPSTEYARPDVRAALQKMKRRARVAARAVISAVIRRVLQVDLQHDGATAAELQAAGEQAASAALRAEGQLHAAAALNQGRGDEIDAHADVIAGVRYTALLDGSACQPCLDADDDVLRPLDDPVRLARKPPNRDCHGGDRCRCMEFATLKEEAPVSASRWDESEHPRNPEGRFRPKAGAASLEGLAEVDATTFHASFTRAATDPRFGPFLTRYTADDFKGMRCFLAERGTVGGALKPTPEGVELVSLFNLGGPRGAGLLLAEHLIGLGANRLDCIGPNLRRKYETLGFEVVAQFAWDDEQAPENWRYDLFDRPPIFVMELRRGR